MLNFSAGPVQSSPEVLSIGAEQVPYFRTPNFSELMLENERLLLEFAGASEGSRAVFLTGSGTAAMESVVMHVLNRGDRALVVDGGSFGHRFCRLCSMHGIPYDAVIPAEGESVGAEDLERFEGGGYTAFLVNMHETSKGVLYDMDLVGEFCRRHGMLLIVDAISSFLADPINVESMGIGALIVGSQKALACPPGVSAVVLDGQAQARVLAGEDRSLYLSLKEALKDGERGQTPWTCAVGTMMQLNVRLRLIGESGGQQAEVKKVAALAADFRTKTALLPLEVTSRSPSNAITPLHPLNVPAGGVVGTLRDEYGIWVCPNGGELADYSFRVGHMGALTLADNDALVGALRDMEYRGLL